MFLLFGILMIGNIFLIFYVFKKSINFEEYNRLKTERDSLLIEKSKQEEIINNKNNDIKKLQEENREYATRIDNLRNELNRVIVDKRVLEEKLQQQNKDIQKLREDMSINFKNISNNVIQEQGENFKKTQRDIFSAFQNEVKQFISKVEENTKTNNINKVAFEEQIKLLNDKSENLAKEANDLTAALKGNKKIQGNWGENQLERLFEMNGWVEGVDYTKQETTYNEDGKMHRPDYIINLPNNRRVVVDSKVSLSNYVNYIEAESKEDKEKYLKNYVGDIKNHIKELSNKEYQKELNAKSLDYVFMFMPLEHAYIDAVSFDNTVYDNIFENKIAVVTSSSLLPIIKAINNLWNIEKQNKNTEKIVVLADKIYDKVVSFQEDMEKIGDILSKADEVYSKANKKLYEGNANLYKLTSEMKKYGLNTNKRLKNVEINEYIDDNTESLDLVYNISDKNDE